MKISIKLLVSFLVLASLFGCAPEKQEDSYYIKNIIGSWDISFKSKAGFISNRIDTYYEDGSPERQGL